MVLGNYGGRAFLTANLARGASLPWLQSGRSRCYWSWLSPAVVRKRGSITGTTRPRCLKRQLATKPGQPRRRLLPESRTGRWLPPKKGQAPHSWRFETGLNLPARRSPGHRRKIIYDAQVDLIVESVDPVAKKVGSLVQEARGYIAEQNVTGSPGTQRSMRWRFRIPVEQFDSFVDSIVALGELERNNRTSQDVTEQYYDLEARIKNKRVEEQTLNKILQERSGKLEDVLKIEIELSRVRGEIEQLEGKIRVLENLASLATLTLNVRERDKYAPPPPVVADFRDADRPDVGWLAARPEKHGQVVGALGRELGDLDSVLARRPPCRLGPAALADPRLPAEPAPAGRSRSHADRRSPPTRAQRVSEDAPGLCSLLADAVRLSRVCLFLARQPLKYPCSCVERRDRRQKRSRSRRRS